MDWQTSTIIILAAALFGCGFLPRLRAYRSLIWGGAILATISGLYPRPNYGLASLLLLGWAPLVRRF